MGVSIGSAAGIGYYTGGRDRDEQKREQEREPRSYYTAGAAKGEPPGVWRGRLAADLGLVGEVRFKDMETVFTRFVAPDGTKLGQAPGKYKSVEDRLTQWVQDNPGALPEDVDKARRAFEARPQQALLGEDITWSPIKDGTVAHTAAWRAENEARASAQEARGMGMEAQAAEYEAKASSYARVREAIEAALWEANEAAMVEAEAVAVTRRAAGHGAGVKWWDAAPDHVRASFFQHTARPVNGEQGRSVDPQLHIHNVILNKARCADGSYRALDTEDLKAQRPRISAVADRVFAQGMARRGFDMAVRPDGKAWAMKAVDPALSDLFSERTRAIKRSMGPVVAAAEEKLGRSLTGHEMKQIADKATLFSRTHKDATESEWGEYLDQWQERSQEQLGRGLVPLAAELRIAHEAALARGGREPVVFSPERVASVALHAVQEAAGRKGTWTEADLMMHVELAAPLMPELDAQQSRAMLQQITDMAIEQYATQVAGRDTLPELGAAVPGLGFQRPSAVRYASPETILGEQRIRDAAAVGGRTALDRDVVDAWLTENYPTIGRDQREAVLGLASSDRGLSVLSAPAGTGKSYATGAFAQAWEALSGGGRVHGLTVSDIAAKVLHGDGVEHTSNLTAWLDAQERLAAGRPRPGDERFALTERDVLVVDEASMVGTEAMDRTLTIADKAGAKVYAAGDPAQLGAIDAGGVLDLLAGRADTYTLTEVRRFKEAWEAKASLGLRDGSKEALAEYDKHGRLLGYDSPEALIAGTARAAAADRLAGASSLVVAGSNAEAAATAAAIREHLIEAGLVQAEGRPLGRDENVAGVGDEVMTRQNDRRLGISNRDRFHVAEVMPDGSLRVADKDGVEKVLPARYVDEHVQLAYAGTVHAAEGVTVDRSHFLTRGDGDASLAYVALGRGRERNTAHVLTAQRGDGPEAKSGGGVLEVEEGQERPSALAVLSGWFSREKTSDSALVTAERDDEREHGMRHLLERMEGATGFATRQRLERHLDDLHADGLLSTDQRARLCGEKGTDHLARLLRAVEQTGQDPQQALRDALAERELDGSRSVSEVLSYRLEGRHDLRTAAPGRGLPEGVAEPYTQHLAAIRDRMDARALALGGQVAEQEPEWAVKALGRAPEDAMERLDWQERAGRIAAYREATGWEDAKRAIDHAPGVTSTERRGLWWGAWEALGRPESTREEAGLSDGALQARVQAWERAKEWAPPHADDSLRNAEQEAEKARHEATLARARGDEEEAQRQAAEAERNEAVTRAMGRVAAARAEWEAGNAETRAVAESAGEELTHRGVAPGKEDDRVPAEEWLEAERQAREKDDAHRQVTEADIEEPAAEEERDAVREQAAEPKEREDPGAAHQRAELDPSPERQDEMVEQAKAAEERELDHQSRVAAWEAREAEEPVAEEPEPVVEAEPEPVVEAEPEPAIDREEAAEQAEPEPVVEAEPEPVAEPEAVADLGAEAEAEPAADASWDLSPVEHDTGLGREPEEFSRG